MVQSLVLALPPHTKDWKEFQGKTYCLIDSEWQMRAPILSTKMESIMNDQDRPHESYRPPESMILKTPCVKIWTSIVLSCNR